MWCYRRGYNIAIWVLSGLDLQIERFVELVVVPLACRKVMEYIMEEVGTWTLRFCILVGIPAAVILEA